MTEFFLSHKKLTLFFWSLLISGFLTMMLVRLLSDELIIDNSVAVWFLADDPELIQYQRYNQDFGEK